MKKGKIILGLAAAAITVGSALAFRVAHKFTSHSVFVKTALGFCQPCANLFFTGSGGGANRSCTLGTANHVGHQGAPVGGNHVGFWTSRTVGKTCQNEVTITTVTH